MPCLIQDYFVTDPSGTGTPNLAIVAQPMSATILQNFSGTWKQLSADHSKITALTDPTGLWSLTLPWPSLIEPAAMQWQILTPDRSVWQGLIPEGIAGPLTIETLEETYGWNLVAGPASSAISYITGPPGANGAPGIGVWRGAWSSGAAYAVNDLVYDAGSTYLCILTRSGTATHPASDPTYWSIVALGGSAGSGTVTSVGLAGPSIFSITGTPVTTVGTLTMALATQTLNTILAGPSSGGPAAPTFRALVTADLPAGLATVTSVGLSLPSIITVTGSPITTTGTLTGTLATQTANQIFAGPSSGGAVAPTFRALVTADLPAGVGTVASVAMTVPSILSVAGSPITGSGTLAVTLATETANLIFAGPSSGGAVAPTFRALVTADMPAGTGTVTSVALALPSIITVTGSPVTASGTLTGTLTSQAQNAVLVGPTSGSGTPTFRALVAGDLPAGTGSGTVTSVAMTVPSILSVAGSPVTTSGTLAVTLATQTANIIFAGPSSGGAVVPTFRAMVNADLMANLQTTTISASGLTGATAASRYAGATASGAPASGTFALGDYVVDQTGKVWVCTVAGSPGTWVNVGAGGTGTVTSVAMTVPSILSVAGSPITTSGTLAVTLATQTANLIFAGPGSGGAVIPTFRAMVNLDLPANLQATTISASGLTGATAASRYAGATASGAPLSGTFLLGDYIVDQTAAIYVCTVAGTPGTWVKVGAAGSGTVTSVAMTLPSILSVAGSPITTSGTLAVTLATETANLVFAGPSSGAAAAPTFRALVNLDLPTNLQTTTISASGLTGATAASRYGGATASGAPVSGTWAVGDHVIDQTGKLWICTAAGTPGTWVNAGAGGSAGGDLTGTYPNPTFDLTKAHTWTGIQTLPLYDKAGQVNNVKAYGALGDGTTDDTTAIQAAITALPAAGGTALFPPGTYKVTAAITVTSGVRLIGSGRKTTQIAGTTADAIVKSGIGDSLTTTVEYVEIRDIRLTALTTTPRCLDFRWIGHSIVADCILSGGATYTLHVGGSTASTSVAVCWSNSFRNNVYQAIAATTVIRLDGYQFNGTTQNANSCIFQDGQVNLAGIATLAIDCLVATTSVFRDLDIGYYTSGNGVLIGAGCLDIHCEDLRFEAVGYTASTGYQISVNPGAARTVLLSNQYDLGGTVPFVINGNPSSTTIIDSNYGVPSISFSQKKAPTAVATSLISGIPTDTTGLGIRHMELVGQVLLSSTSGFLYLQINGDTAANYVSTLGAVSATSVQLSSASATLLLVSFRILLPFSYDPQAYFQPVLFQTAQAAAASVATPPTVINGTGSYTGHNISSLTIGVGGAGTMTGNIDLYLWPI